MVLDGTFRSVGIFLLQRGLRRPVMRRSGGCLGVLLVCRGCIRRGGSWVDGWGGLGLVIGLVFGDRGIEGRPFGDDGRVLKRDVLHEIQKR